jgi:rubrerythrin
VTVEVVDQRAVREEALEPVAADSRQAFLRRAVVGGGAIVAGGILVAGLPRFTASAAPSAQQDVRILNFAALLEYLQAAFFTEAEVKAALSGETRQFARVAGDHERQHVNLFERTLGSKLRKKPTFDFGDATSDADRFRATAVVLEDLAVAAYDGQAALLTKPTLRVAAQIVSVESRHAAWARSLVGKSPAPRAYDPPATRPEVMRVVNGTNFVTSA